MLITGGSLTLDVAWTDTIEDVKQKVEGACGIPLDQQHPHFNRKQLEDGRTLLYYDITIDSTLYLTKRQRGD